VITGHCVKDWGPHKVQVTWLVVTELRSESFGLVTERRHYSARPIYASRPYVAHVIFFIVECGIARFLYAMRVFDVRASSSPQATFVPNFVFVAPSIAELAHGEKIAYSITHSLTQLIWFAGNRSFRFGKSVPNYRSTPPTRDGPLDGTCLQPCMGHWRHWRHWLKCGR